MGKVYGFNVSGESALFGSEAAWDKQMTVEGAKRYLKDHLLAQLTRDVPPAIDAFIDVYRKTGVGVGFWAVARMVFPAISFLGCLYKGDDSTGHAIEFLEGRETELEERLRERMREAAGDLRFEEALHLRNHETELRRLVIRLREEEAQHALAAELA